MNKIKPKLFCRKAVLKDLKKSNFIKEYFTDKEIAYSESRSDAIETICGIYSAKESWQRK